MRFRSLASLFLIGAAAAFAAPAPDVAEATLATAVVDRAPSGAAATFPAGVGELYCWTRVVGFSPGSRIEHVWYRGDREVHRRALDVGGANWRTWSSKSIPPDGTGPWHVDVVGPGGVVLRTLTFEIR